MGLGLWLGAAAMAVVAGVGAVALAALWPKTSKSTKKGTKKNPKPPASFPRAKNIISF